jgi:hypothetical protein
VKRKESGAEIENASGARLFRIRRDGEGWKVEDAAGTLVAKAKAKPDGFELRDPEGATIAKAKRREGKVVLETEAGDRLSEVDGITEPLAGVWFALDRFSLPERAAVAVYFLRVHR